MATLQVDGNIGVRHTKMYPHTPMATLQVDGNIGVRYTKTHLHTPMVAVGEKLS